MVAEYLLLHSPRGLWTTVSCQRCRPQVSMGAKGARCSMNTKGAQRKILPTLHPNTILNPTLTLTPDPNPQLTPNPTPNQD